MKHIYQEQEHMASKSPCFCCCNLTHGSGEIILLVSRIIGI